MLSARALVTPELALAGIDRNFSIVAGSQEVRLAHSKAEIAAAQELRYRVFYHEMGASPTAAMAAAGRDFDAYDENCDHLLVLDHARGPDTVVGTYRLIRRSMAAKAGGFYSAQEFCIDKLAEYPGEILELGRSCVDAAYRNRASMQLLWRGIASYIVLHDIQLLFGCASLHGTDPRELALPLSYLHWYHQAPPGLCVTALPHRYVYMRHLERAAIDPKAGFNSLPPLLKAYLRVNCYIGDGAVIDEQFNTTDVCVIVKADLINEKYFRHLGGRGGDLSIV